MEKQAIKNLIQSKIDSLEVKWSKMVDNEDRVTASDYLKAGEVQGAINALMEVLIEIDRA